MNIKIKKHILFMSLSLCVSTSFGHDQKVHKAITENAVDSASAFPSAYASFLDIVSSDVISSVAREDLSQGSWNEDNRDNGDSGGKRSLNHFYDPLTGSGLSDTPLGGGSPIGLNSFTWASVSNCAGINHFYNQHPINEYSWQNARGDEWVGLTAANQTTRQAALSAMFRSVGQVMHLLQDDSQPQHVRNEQHLDTWWVGGPDTPWRSPIEDYYKDHSINYPPGMLDWRSAGLTKLEDFWDRHLYNGSGTALDAAEHGGAQLGLAEWCNGNFIGARHTYAEFFAPSSIKYYPHPSLADTTQPNLQEGNLWDTATHGDVTLENFKHGTRLYISKTPGAGVPVTFHSALGYLVAEHPGKASGIPTLLISDDNVLSNYHALLIPKAIQYSAGLLDYFFRGALDVSLGLGKTPGNLCLTIKNQSGADFSDGEFHLYSEDNAGNRSGISTTNLTGSLNNGASANLEFTPPQITQVAYVLVYRGTIGASNSIALDPVDANIAIAAKRFTTCGLDNDDLTPSKLSYVDFSVLGTIHLDRSSPKTSFGSFPLGIYQIMYVDGVYHSHTRPDAPSPLTPGADQWGTRWGGGGDPYGTSAYYCRADGNEYDTRTLPGTKACDTSSSEDVVAATLEANPAIQFVHTGGAIGLQPHTEVWICNNWEIPDTGGPTYRLERLRSFYPQPNRIRIQNYDEVIRPLFASTNCAVYMDASGAPEWDGSFNDRYLGSETMLWWDSPSENLAANGKVMAFATVTYVPFPSLQLIQCGADSGWEVQIDSLTSEGDWVIVWQGWKITGTTPVGTYFRGNADPSLCDFSPDCIHIESY